MLGHDGDLGTINCNHLEIQIASRNERRAHYEYLALQILQLSLNDLHHVSIGEAVGDLLLVHRGQLNVQTLWSLFKPLSQMLNSRTQIMDVRSYLSSSAKVGLTPSARIAFMTKFL